MRDTTQQTLQLHLRGAQLEAEEIRQHRDAIRSQVLQARGGLLRPGPDPRPGDFVAIRAGALALLYDAYQTHFLSECMSRELLKQEGIPFRLRFSTRMTRVGGTTARRGSVADPEYEIAISLPLLWQSFGRCQLPVEVGGLACVDRLDALQRILEHEIVHLAEFLAWGHSSCSKRRFAAIALRLFGHTERHHSLVTKRREAAECHGIAVGDQVMFHTQHGRCVGEVMRITKRATVRVPCQPSTRGSRMDADGFTYLRYYVPVERLSPAPAATHRGK